MRSARVAIVCTVVVGAVACGAPTHRSAPATAPRRPPRPAVFTGQVGQPVPTIVTPLPNDLANTPASVKAEAATVQSEADLARARQALEAMQARKPVMV